MQYTQIQCNTYQYIIHAKHRSTYEYIRIQIVRLIVYKILTLFVKYLRFIYLYYLTGYWRLFVRLFDIIINEFREII